MFGVGFIVVWDVLPSLIEKNASVIIYSCGPMGMLAAVEEVSKTHSTMHQCAVEESMACGVGICMTCVMPVKTETGEVKNLRSCIDGPVMDGELVQWHLVGSQL